MALALSHSYDVALHWSRGFQALEKNMCRNYNWNQPSSGELEVYSRRFNLPVHSWAGSSISSLFSSSRTNSTWLRVLTSSWTWAGKSICQWDSIHLCLPFLCPVDFPSFHIQKQKNIHSSYLGQSPRVSSCLSISSYHYILFNYTTWPKLPLPWGLTSCDTASSR